MANHSLQPIDISPAEFLRTFFQPHETVCIRILPDKKGTAFSEQKLESDSAYIEKIIPLLEEHNKQERGIFFVVNFGGHDGKNIRRINAQFVDIDHGPLEDQVAAMDAFPLEPSLIVKTRRGLHCYWLMKNASVERFSHIQKQLVKHFDGDPQCVDLPRVLRVPGFYHHKEDQFLIECVKFNPELRYTQDQLAEHLPEVPEDNPTAPSESAIKGRGTQNGLVLAWKRCLFFQYCRKNAKTLPEPLWYAMITNLALFENGEAAIHKQSRPYPKYSFAQTQAKIEHFHKSGTKPITCRRIAENGFACPKFKDGSCRCKSPAGLAFFPLEAAALPKALASVKAKHDPVMDIESARTFVKDYLYNIDPGVAEVFINNNIREHFGFKTTDIKSLPAFHKELYRGFASLREVKTDKYKEELPAWYEFNSRGELRFMPSVLADYCVKSDPVIYVGENYYFYENGVYVPKNDMAAERHIRNHMARDRFKTTAQIKDAEHQWRIQIDKPVTEINPNVYLINFRNTMYNVLTDELIMQDPKFMSTIQIHANYKPEAECPVFLSYLKGVLPETEHPLIQEILGYILIAVNKAQKSFLLVGKKDSGKSTMLYVVNDVLLGKENVSTLSWHAMDDKFQTFQLFGKLANIFADLPSRDLQDSGIFKAVTGEDYIMGERKHKDGFSFKPFARLLFSCNKIPKNYNDRSDAFYGRLILIRFDHSFPEDKQDKSLKEKLMTEADGILMWALIGLKRLMRNNYVFSETDRTRSEMKKYMNESSTVLTFLDEECEAELSCESFRDDVYNAYAEFCASNGSRPMSKIRFNEEVCDYYGDGVQKCQIMNRKAWRGLRLKQ